MNAAGLIVVLTQISSGLGMPFYQTLVTDGSIQQGEFEGTRKNLAAVLATIKNTPTDKIEAMVAQHDANLTAHLDSYNSKWGADPLGGFRDAQVIAGYVTTIMAKSGLTE
ncbi:MAG TPA: hypothetical protein VGC66_14015 [Pyrinomonadaceae bacterium]|jgi:hypothetical protein